MFGLIGGIGGILSLSPDFDYKRYVLLKIYNNTKKVLASDRSYFESGQLSTGYPQFIQPGQAIEVQVRKKYGSYGV